MQPRFNFSQSSADAYQALIQIERYLHRTGLEASLLHMIKLRASQMNGCAYCIDMHWKDLKALGETDQRMYSLDAWRECPYYSERERAALAWTEAVTRVADGHVPDEVYQALKAQFSDQEISDLTVAAALINTWNRLVIASRTTPGTYQPAHKGS